MPVRVGIFLACFNVMLKSSRLISLFALGPLLFYPFSFCPFRLPYLYCFVCPTRCNWGRTRWVILLIALGLNLKERLFCNYLCPFGMMQVLLFKLKSRKFVLLQFMHNFKYIILALIVIVIAITCVPELSSAHKFMGSRDLLLGALFLGIILSIFIYRAFCYILCPFRALVEILTNAFR